MKKVLLSILIFVCIAGTLGLLTACGGINGTYYYEKDYYIKFSSSGSLEWHERGTVFSGTYEKVEEGFILKVKGSGFVPSQEFEAHFDDENNLVVDGKVFSKDRPE